MHILNRMQAHPSRDGDGVNISRVHDFQHLSLDPYLMMDEIRSDDRADYIGGFPPHPHRGIETFTYMIKGGFEHRDQMGNVGAIRAGDVQWMSTGYGVVHSEMPLMDEGDSLHGFQIWLNMPAKDKLRPSRYADTADLPDTLYQSAAGNSLRALAGNWTLDGQAVEAHLHDLAADAGIADIRVPAGASAQVGLPERGQLLLLVHSGELADGLGGHGTLLKLKPEQEITIKAGNQGLGALVFYGNPIGEAIAHMGPFVMNTQAELQQAIMDYRDGKFGQIPA